MSHRCLAPGCPSMCSDDFLMCRPHWRQVPKAIATRIWDAVGKRGTERQTYLDAVGEAIIAVGDKNQKACHEISEAVNFDGNFLEGNR